MSAENAWFAFVFIVAVGFFALNVQRLVRYLRLGLPEDRTNRIWQRVANLFTIGDGAGVTRGLVQASASGVIAAREIMRRAL